MRLRPLSEVPDDLGAWKLDLSSTYCPPMSRAAGP